MIYDNSSVRRQDRLLDETAARDLLRRGEYGVLSLVRPDSTAYGLPTSYAWDGADVLYLHCAPEGEKLRCLAHCAELSFCVVGRTRVEPSRFTTAYESIILTCRASVGLAAEERMRALELLLAKYCPDDAVAGRQYVEKSFSRTEIIRLDILRWSGKSKRIAR